MASSTLWISELGGAAVQGKDLLIYLSLYIGSLFIVYIPGALSSYQFEKAKNRGIKAYVEKFSTIHQNTPHQIEDKQKKAELQPWITSEGAKTVEETYIPLYDSISLGLNMILNVGALCITIGPKILIGYGISFLFMAILGKFFQSALGTRADRLQTDRVSFSQNLLVAWDNIVVGNNYNFSIWFRQFNERWQSFNQSSLNMTIFSQLVSSLSMMCSLIPITGTLVWLFMGFDNTKARVAFITTLPRQIQIIQNLQLFSAYTIQFPGIYVKYKNLLETITSKNFDRTGILERIQKDKITFQLNGKSIRFDNFDQLMNRIRLIGSCGRLTIQGPNGSGKTTLVSLIKRELGNKAYYLPVQTDLLFIDDLEESLSTGQKMIAHLKEVSRVLAQKAHFYDNGLISKKEVLILDEWGSNLDTDNTSIISMMIDEMAQERWVIEIYHDKTIREKKEYREAKNEREDTALSTRFNEVVLSMPEEKPVKQNAFDALLSQFDKSQSEKRSLINPPLSLFNLTKSASGSSYGSI